MHAILECTQQAGLHGTQHGTHCMAHIRQHCMAHCMAQCVSGSSYWLITQLKLMNGTDILCPRRLCYYTAKIQNSWSYTSTSPHVFMESCSISFFYSSSDVGEHLYHSSVFNFATTVNVWAGVAQSVVTRLRIGRPRNHGSIPDSGTFFSSLKRPNMLWSPPSLLFSQYLGLQG